MSALPATTKAIANIARKKVELIDAPFDTSPLKPTEIAGETLVTLVSPGTEINGNFDVDRTAPWVGGYAAVFKIHQVGSSVSDLSPGQNVLAMGPHAAWQRIDRQEVVVVPEGLSAETAVFARLMAVTWTTLTTTRARPADRVVIAGLGLVGNLAAQIFQAAGYRVTAVDSSPRRRNLAGNAGIRDIRAAISTEKDLTDAISLAVDCTANEQTVLDCCRVVKKGGEVALVGVPWRKRTEVPAFEILHAVFHRYIHLRSGWEWEIPRNTRDFAAGSVYGNFASAMDWLHSGRVRVDGLFKFYPPTEAQNVFDLLYRRDNDFLTAVFNWQSR